MTEHATHRDNRNAPGERPEAPKPAQLLNIAAIVQVTAVLYGIGAVIGGVATALSSQPSTDGIAATHPHVGLGVSLAASAPLIVFVVIMLAEWASLYASTVRADL